MQRALYGVTAMTLLSYAGEYMAFTSVLAWLDLLLLGAGYTPTQAFGFGFLVSSSYLLLSGVLAVPLGFLADIFGRRKVGVAGCILAGVSIAAVSLTGSLRDPIQVIVVISILLLLIGVGHATYTTSALAYAGDVSTEADVGEAYGLVETAEYAMFMFGTPLGLALADTYGNVSTFYITGGILMAGALAAFVGMPERRSPSGEGLPPSLPSTVHRLRLLASALSDSHIDVSLLSVFFVSIGFTVYRVYMTQFGTNATDPLQIGPILVSIMALASVIAAIPVGRLVDRTKRPAILISVGLIIEGVALALIFYSPSSLTLLLWSVVFGVSVMLVRVPQAVVIAERTVFENRASAMGANHGVEHVGYGVGAFIGGVLLVFFGFTTLDTFWLVAAIGAAFGIVLIPLIRRLKMP